MSVSPVASSPARFGGPCRSLLGHQLLGAEVREFFEHAREAGWLARHPGVQARAMNWCAFVAAEGGCDERCLKTALELIAELVDRADVPSDFEMRQSALNLEISLRLHLESAGSLL